MAGQEPLRPIQVGSTYVLVTSEEHAEDRTARIAREQSDQAHRRWAEKLILGCFAAMVMAIGLTTFFLVAWYSDKQDKEWARSVLTALVTGGISYMAGKQAQRD